MSKDMQDKRCQRLTAHVSHTWWWGTTNPDRYFCKGVTTGAAPTEDREPGGLQRKQCDDARPHRAHSHWDVDSEQTCLCEGAPATRAHNPNVNCDCEPNSAYPRARCEYRTLADAVRDNLPVADGDAPELALLVDAVDGIGGALRALRTPPGNGGA